MTNESHNAIIISLDDNTSEINELTKSLDYVVIKEFIQYRKKMDP